MNENTMGGIYLEPEKIIKNAEEIAEKSKNDEKFVFRIQYESAARQVVLAEISRLDCEIINQSDSDSTVTVRISMPQLAAIKTLNCIEKVETVDAESISAIKADTAAEAISTVNVQMAANSAIAPLCYGGGSDGNGANTMQTAHYLPLALWKEGCICCPGAEQWYRFTASISNAVAYTIYTSGSVDTIGRLYSSDGTLLASDDDSGTDCNFKITKQLTTGATYYVKVKGYSNSVGNYKLRIDYTTKSSSGGLCCIDDSNTMLTAHRLSLETWKSGSICCPCAEQWYKFTTSITGTDTYTIYTIGSLDTVGYLYDANGELLASNDDANGNYNFEITKQLARSTTYYVKVRAYGNNKGSYKLRVDYTTQSSDDSCSSGKTNTMQTAYDLPLATWKSGRIHLPGKEQWFKFTASISNATEYIIYTSGSLNTVGNLYNANGILIASNDDSNGNCNFKITKQLVYGATYYIKVKAYGLNTGSYDLRVSYSTQVPSGGSCDVDDSNTMQTAHYLPLALWKQGRICCPCAEQWYRFTASISEADTYTIYTSGSLDTVGYLYDANGTLLASNDDSNGSCNFMITRQLTAGSRYYVKVKGFANNTGDYELRVDYTIRSSSGGDTSCDEDKTSASELVVNSWQSGEICCPCAVKWYKFTPQSSAYYTIYTVGSLDTVGALYDDNDDLIKSNDDGGQGLNFKLVSYLTAGQTYYIKVNAFGNKTGRYSIAAISAVFVESVSISNHNITLKKGETAALTAEVLPSYATNKSVLWRSENDNVVTVSPEGVITAVDGGTVCVSAIACDGSGRSGCCAVTVNVLVESVRINDERRIMYTGTTDRFEVTVCPHNATNKLVRWSSTNTNVATVDPATGKITAISAGTARIIATAQDGTGKSGACELTVKPAIPVKGVTIGSSTYTMKVGETTRLSYSVYPVDATNQTVRWNSSNHDVADVGFTNGKITAKHTGKTTISVTTNDGNFVASCEVTVKGAVVIKKDGINFNVIFEDGKIWKYSDYYYDERLTAYMPLDRQRTNDNAVIDFSIKQLALLFRLDPKGVTYYVSNKVLQGDTSPTDYLIYRDNVFKEIYGVPPRYFTYEDSQLRFCTGINNSNRYYVYSEAELLFGMLPRHSLKAAIETILGIALSLISIYVPAVGYGMLTFEVVTAFFFTGAIDGAVNAAAGELVDKVIEKAACDDAANRRMSWVVTIIGAIPDLLESELPPEIDEGLIAVLENAYNNESYEITASNDEQTVDLKEFIEYYKNLSRL